jgi:hypothetical protein
MQRTDPAGSAPRVGHGLSGCPGPRTGGLLSDVNHRYPRTCVAVGGTRGHACPTTLGYTDVSTARTDSRTSNRVAGVVGDTGPRRTAFEIHSLLLGAPIVPGPPRWFAAALAIAGVLVAAPATADEPIEPAAEPAPIAAEPAKTTVGPVVEPATTAAARPTPIQPATERAIGDRFAPWPIARLAIELELYTQARMTARDGEDLSEVRLDRGELGGRLALGTQAAAELRFEAIRSAVEGGSLGIDGDSTVFRLKTAQLVATQSWSQLRLDGAIGFVPDPWIATLEGDYTVKPLSRTGSERLLGWPTSDLSGLARAAYGPVRATVAIGNGEGPQFPERNSGKTTTAVLEAVPLATPNVRLTIAGVVRDGSIGVASIRDRRFGGGASIVTPWVRGGVEVIRAQGLGDVAEAEGVLAGGWADARVIDRVFVAARGATLGFADGGGRQSTFGGAVAVEPWREKSAAADRARGRFRIWLAVDRVTSSGGAMPVPGADAGRATLVMLVASAIAPFTVE